MKNKSCQIESDLQNVFHLSTYDECINWTAKDWYEALIIRSELFF